MERCDKWHFQISAKVEHVLAPFSAKNAEFMLETYDGDV